MPPKKPCGCRALMVLALFASFFFPSLQSLAGVTWNPGGVGTGVYPTGGTDTRVRLTGTAKTYLQIPMDSIKQGATSVLAPALTPQATVVYAAQAVSQTGNSINWAAAAANVSFTVNVDVPLNYERGGTLELLLIYNATDTAVRLAAGVTNQTTEQAVAQHAGTSTDPGSPLTPTWVSLPNSQTYKPQDHLTFQVNKTAGTTAIVSVLSARFKYKPWSVIP